jgi:hypothetical protein
LYGPYILITVILFTPAWQRLAREFVDGLFVVSRLLEFESARQIAKIASVHIDAHLRLLARIAVCAATGVTTIAATTTGIRFISSSSRHQREQHEPPNHFAIAANSGLSAKNWADRHPDLDDAMAAQASRRSSRHQ